MSQSIETSNGTTLEYNSAGTTYVAISEILDMKGPMAKRKVIMTAAIADTVATKKAGRPDYGEVTFQCGFVKAGYVILHGLFVSGALTGYKLTNPTNTLQAFSAIVTDLSPSYPDDEKIVYDVTLSISGAVTLT